MNDINAYSRTDGVRLTIALLASTFCIAPAQADVSVRTAEYAGGILVVRGQTSKPNERVTLDNRFVEHGNRFGEFTFRIRYLPNDCMVSLRTSEGERPAFVKGCVSTGSLMPESPPFGWRSKLKNHGGEKRR